MGGAQRRPHPRADPGNTLPDQAAPHQPFSELQLFVGMIVGNYDYMFSFILFLWRLAKGKKQNQKKIARYCHSPKVGSNEYPKVEPI